MAEGFLLDKGSVNRIAAMMTRVNGPQGLPVGGKAPQIGTFQIKHVRLLAVDPSPDAISDMIGYTAEVLRMDLTSNTLEATGVTFDPDGDTEDDSIIKSYIYEINKRDDLVGKVGEATYKRSTNSVASGAWVFSGGGGGSRPYVIITAVTDLNNYVGDVRTPTDATVLEADVDIQALDPNGGATLQVGDKFFADLTDDVYYINPSVFRGA